MAVFKSNDLKKSNVNTIKEYDFHNPVLPDTVCDFLINDPNGIYFDGTIGGGGHAKVIINKLKSKGKLIGVDVDTEALKFAEKSLGEFKSRVILKTGSYSDIIEILQEENIENLNGIILDLGISSYQIDNKNRGFSYSYDGPLDMRMNNSLKINASYIINKYKKRELTEIFKKYGEEKFAASISSIIVREREKKPIKTTYGLKSIIENKIHGKYAVKSLSRIFQALRIEVNNELRNLEKFLKCFTEILVPGGRAVIISYHSLEDRLVKRYFQFYAKECICPPSFPVCVCGKKKTTRILTKKPVLPSTNEIKANPRARSAKLRAVEKL